MVQFRVLGPLEIRAGAAWAGVSAPKWRSLLAALLAEPGQVISAERLADELWGAAPPAGARKLVSGYIRRLRQLADDPDGRVLVTRSHGYQAMVTRADLDVGRFEDLLASGRSALAAQDARQARTLLADALAVWRGSAFADVPLGPLAAVAASRLEELRLFTVELRIEADISCGQLAELVPELRGFTAEHPLRERLWYLLMRVLQACGRSAEALETYAQARAVIAEELGADPGPELQKLHQRILAGDPGLATRQAADGPAPSIAAVSRSLAVSRQLPAAVAHFTGRVAELAELSRLLAQSAAAEGGAVQICAIGGTAGVGKTSLALHWAHQVTGQFPDGQLYLNLRGFGPSGLPVTSGEALRHLLDGLEVPPERIPADPDTQAGLYRSLLAGRRMIIVLDNASDPAQVRPLLPGAPGCLVLITSRNQLAGLAATDGAHLLTLDLLTEAEARELLTRRLGTQRVADEPDAVLELATLCARLPLALSIAAARAAARPGLPLATLAAELRDERIRLDALDAGDAAADIRTVFSWSCQQLSGPTARMFRLLGEHLGPDFTAPAATSLAGLPPDVARQALAELIQAHLIAEDAPGRYTVHDLLRSYAAEQARRVESDTDLQAAALRILDHYLHTACAASQLLHPHRDPITLSPMQPQVLPEGLADRPQALAWFQAERQVLLAAITQAARAGFNTQAWQLAWAVATFLNWQGYWHELVEAQQSALGAARRAGDLAGQAEAHRYLAQAQIRLGAYADAAAHLTKVIELSQRLGRTASQARAHIDLVRALEMQGRYREGLGHAEQSLELYRAAGHRSGEASALNTVGWCHAHLGAHQQALDHCGHALAAHRQLGNRVGEANVLDSLGYIHLQIGDHAQAIACYEQAFDAHGDAGDLRDGAGILIRLGDAHQAAADPVAARRTWQQALAILDDLQHPDASKVTTKLHALTLPSDDTTG